MTLIQRPRRLRQNPIIREMVAETRLNKEMFVYPYFVVGGKNLKLPISAMPGIYHFSIDQLVLDVEAGMKNGINKILLFGVGEEKSEDGRSASGQNTIVARAVKELKKHFGAQLYVITDVCVCAYTTHGHCGILHQHEIDNDKSLIVLANMALSHAQAGANMVAPSDMMDGRVGAIRKVLDENGYTNTALMSYAIKFASAYYGPFRSAADSSPQEGDRKSYQMDPRNRREALREGLLDEQEGADILMVKPALAYLDVIAKLRQQTNLPVSCYNVSGEYSMVKAAAQLGLVDEQKIVMENMHAFARAGADIIITYHARDIVNFLWM